MTATTVGVTGVKGMIIAQVGIGAGPGRMSVVREDLPGATVTVGHGIGTMTAAIPGIGEAIETVMGGEVTGRTRGNGLKVVDPVAKSRTGPTVAAVMTVEPGGPTEIVKIGTIAPVEGATGEILAVEIIHRVMNGDTVAGIVIVEIPDASTVTVAGTTAAVMAVATTTVGMDSRMAETVGVATIDAIRIGQARVIAGPIVGAMVGLLAPKDFRSAEVMRGVPRLRAQCGRTSEKSAPRFCEMNRSFLRI